MKYFPAFTFYSLLVLTLVLMLIPPVSVQAQLPEIALRIRTMAHRGDYYNAPENTLPGFKMAIATGVDFCEFDGKTIIYYAWGSQTGEEYLSHAVYDGSETDFLRAWFTR